MKLAEHMAECRYRIVPCPISDCRSKILFNSMSEHIKGHNAFSGKNNKQVILSMDE